ncbi:hypothetical protein ACWC9U_12890 [Streptomyces sp. 900116325]
MNPVGFGATVIASTVSILAFFGLFGAYAEAFSSFIAAGLSLIFCPLIAWATKVKYYLARPNPGERPGRRDRRHHGHLHLFRLRHRLRTPGHRRLSGSAGTCLLAVLLAGRGMRGRPLRGTDGRSGPHADADDPDSNGNGVGGGEGVSGASDPRGTRGRIRMTAPPCDGRIGASLCNYVSVA